MFYTKIYKKKLKINLKIFLNFRKISLKNINKRKQIFETDKKLINFK